MAAPPEKTIKTLAGKWNMNKTLSDNPEPVFALQGVGYLVRKGIGMASISLDVQVEEKAPLPPNTSTDPVLHIVLEQTASGLSSTHEHRCMDDVFRPHSDWLFGNVKGKTKWVTLDEVEDEYLKTGWIVDPAAGAEFLRSHVENEEKGWTAIQIWGFQLINGERRYCRNILVTKGKERVTVRLVYDYVA